MTDAETALDNLIARSEQVPLAIGIPALHAQLRELANSNFLIRKKPWLNAAELLRISKLVYLNGSGSKRSIQVDFAALLNANKELWRASDAQTTYTDDPQFLGSFILRFVYQQLPANITSRKVESNYLRAVALYGGQSEAALKLRKQFESSSGIGLERFLNIAAALYLIFMRESSIADYRVFEMLSERFDRAEISRALRILSATRRQLRRYHEGVAAKSPTSSPYEFNAIYRFPILQHDDRYWCVFPELINYAATRGLYFYISDGLGQSFSAAFADAYEEYMRQLCVDFLGSERVITEKIERGLGWDGKTNDLTLILGEAAILLECKNSGLFSLSKRTAEVVDLASDIRKNLANAEKRKGLFQLYDKIEAIRLGQVPEKVKALYANVKRFYPVVLLHDEIWYANQSEALKNLIDIELRKNGIVDFDYQIWHVEEFQTLVKLVSADRLLNIIAEKYADPHFRQWDLSTYLGQLYKLADLDLSLFVPSGESKPWGLLRRLADANRR